MQSRRDRDTDDELVTTTETYNLYQRTCCIEGTDAVSEPRVRDLLEEAEFLEILSRGTKVAGRGGGSRTTVTLVDESADSTEFSHVSRSGHTLIINHVVWWGGCCYVRR